MKKDDKKIEDLKKEITKNIEDNETEILNEYRKNCSILSKEDKKASIPFYFSKQINDEFAVVIDYKNVNEVGILDCYNNYEKISINVLRLIGDLLNRKPIKTITQTQKPITQPPPVIEEMNGVEIANLPFIQEKELVSYNGDDGLYWDAEELEWKERP